VVKGLPGATWLSSGRRPNSQAISPCESDSQPFWASSWPVLLSEASISLGWGNLERLSGGRMRRVIVWSVFLLTGVLLPMAQEQNRERIDVSKLGPQVGERVPDFTLVDQTGRTQNLQSIMGPRGAMLVFIRSADW
jgi:hypothetical protein